VGQNPIAVTGCIRRQGRRPLDIEDAQVDAARLAVAPAQVPGRHDQRIVIAQNMSEVMQFAAQVSQRLRIR
jgi:hypothetical protein